MRKTYCPRSRPVQEPRRYFRQARFKTTRCVASPFALAPCHAHGALGGQWLPDFCGQSTPRRRTRQRRERQAGRCRPATPCLPLPPHATLQLCNTLGRRCTVARLPERGRGRSPSLSPRLSPHTNRNTATSVDFQRLQAILKRNSRAPCCGSKAAESLIICGLLRCCTSAG